MRGTEENIVLCSVHDPSVGMGKTDEEIPMAPRLHESQIKKCDILAIFFCASSTFFLRASIASL
jgi:hypothetical protein